MAENKKGLGYFGIIYIVRESKVYIKWIDMNLNLYPWIDIKFDVLCAQQYKVPLGVSANCLGQEKEVLRPQNNLQQIRKYVEGTLAQFLGGKLVPNFAPREFNGPHGTL